MNSKLSAADMLKVLGCLIFDIALILAYFKIFSLFIIISPIKSILILFVLIIGLISLNGAIVFPSILHKYIGIPYSAAISVLLILYAAISNIFSIFLIYGSTVWYIVWQLIIFAVLLILFSVIGAFSKNIVDSSMRQQEEQTEKTSIMLQLMEIEDVIALKEDKIKMFSIADAFEKLKERIQAATPFGRIVGNNAVLNMEDKIKANLETLLQILKGNLNDNNLNEVKELLEETRKCVINREKLNLK